MNVIDFKKLRREEKLKAKQRLRVASLRSNDQEKDNDQEKNNGSHQDSLQAIHSLSSLKHVSSEVVSPDMIEPVDFQELRRQEREKVAMEYVLSTSRKNMEDDIQHVKAGMPPSLPSWEFPLQFDRQKHSICTDPPDIHYVANFLSPSQQVSLRDWLLSLKENTASEAVEASWNTLRYGKRRVALFSRRRQDLPFVQPLLEVIVTELVNQGIFALCEKPNHVLVNEYLPDQGIMPHTDGPSYLSRTATVSLESNALIHFTSRLGREEENVEFRPSVQVLLEAGSLLVFEGPAYLNYCHGINADDTTTFEYSTDKCVNAPKDTKVERGYRISLTFRHKKVES